MQGMARRRTDWRGGAAYADRDGESGRCVGALEADVDDGGALGFTGGGGGRGAREGEAEGESCEAGEGELHVG